MSLGRLDTRHLLIKEQASKREGPCRPAGRCTAVSREQASQGEGDPAGSLNSQQSVPACVLCLVLQSDLPSRLSVSSRVAFCANKHFAMADAVIKFWELPEAVEQFLPYTDVFTILSLTEVFPATLKALKGVKAWDNLIRRTFTLPLVQLGWYPDAEIQDQKTKMSYLSKILGKFDNTKKRELMLDLLHLIAQNCPVVIREVILSCPCNETHKVSVLGFRLLEEVESSIAMHWHGRAASCGDPLHH